MTETADTHDPLSVPCPSCHAPARSDDYPEGVTCAHADRREAARAASVAWGVCGLCARPLAKLSDPLEVLHPNPDDAAACPPMPPISDWNAYAEAVNAGLRPGYPGPDQWRPADTLVTNDAGDVLRATPAELRCPECAQGKPQNCAGQALDPVTDELVTCATVTP